MRKSFLSLISIFICLSAIYADDLIVEEGAILPNFNSIQTAVDSASPGDRIFIKNKANNIPWFENVVIDRPLSILPLLEDSAIFIVGNFTITPNATYFSDTVKDITIIGLLDNVGSISTNTNNTGILININVFSCQLNNGVIDFDDDNYRCHVVGNLLKSGGVEIGYGILSGNQIAGGITISDPNCAAGDTTFVIGNRQINEANGYPGGLDWYNSSQYIYIANNYFRYTPGGSRTLYIPTIRGGLGHVIQNNSIQSGPSYTKGISLGTVGAGTEFRIENNAFHDDLDGEFVSSEYAIDLGTVSNTAILIINYNAWQGYGSGFTDYEPFNAFMTGNIEADSATFNLDPITGECNTADCVDRGSPGPQYTDLDLTRNDIGTKGGSFNYNNFWPLVLNNGSKVYFVNTPRSVIQGNTINSSAAGFDR